jgi:hypothetical protein
MVFNTGQWVDALIDTACLAGDSGATLLPGVPGGLGTIRTATRAGKIITKARQAIRFTQPLEPYMKDALRAQGRRLLMKASPMFSKAASKMGKALEVHHIIPLEWVHLMGSDFNPNVIDNLVGIKGVIHQTITEQWRLFKIRIEKAGRKVTRDDVLDFAKYITENYKQYFVR